MIVDPQSDCCLLDPPETFKVFCEHVSNDVLAEHHIYYRDENVCHKVATTRTIYYSDSAKTYRIGDPDYSVVDTVGSMADCCLNIDDYPDNEHACSAPASDMYDSFSWNGETCEKTTYTITGRLVANIGGKEVIVQQGTETSNVQTVGRDECCAAELAAGVIEETTACQASDVFEPTLYEYISETCYVSGYNSVEYSTASPMDGVSSLIVRGMFSHRDED